MLEISPLFNELQGQSVSLRGGKKFWQHRYCHMFSIHCVHHDKSSKRQRMCVFDINIIRDHHKLLLPLQLCNFSIPSHLFHKYHMQIRESVGVADEVKYVSPLFKPQSCLVGPCWNPSGSKKTKTQPYFTVHRAINTEQGHNYSEPVPENNKQSVYQSTRWV